MGPEACAEYAAHMLEYDEAQRDEAVRHFVTCYGDLSVESAIRAHREGEGDERLFALYLIGCLGTQEAFEYLLTVINSGKEAEERASVICLANHRMPQAVPLLIEFLKGPRGTELTPENWQDWLDASFAMSQGYVPVLLGRLGDPRAVPALREALVRTKMAIDPVAANLRLRGISLEQGPEDEYSDQDHLVLADAHLLGLYQDSIVYALGRLGALGALSGLALNTDEQRLWIIHLLMGHLHQKYPIVEIRRWEEMPTLHADLESVLERVVGLTATQRGYYLDLYQRRELSQIALYSEAERLAEERGMYY